MIFVHNVKPLLIFAFYLTFTVFFLLIFFQPYRQPPCINRNNHFQEKAKTCQTCKNDALMMQL